MNNRLELANGVQREANVFPWALLIAAACWVAIIVVWTIRFAASPVESASPLTVDARLVELPQSPTPDRPRPISRKTRAKPIPVAKKPKTVPRPRHKPITKRPISRPTQPHPAAASHRSTAVVQHDVMGARAIYSPLPRIPDDLRNQAISETALARLHIHVDGSVTVELIQPTHNPRINRIILDTLRTWMFYPAIRKGVPVESVQEIKVDVSVGD